MVVRKTKRRIHISIDIDLHNKLLDFIEKKKIKNTLLSDLVSLSIPYWLDTISDLFKKSDENVMKREYDKKIKKLIK